MVVTAIDPGYEQSAVLWLDLEQRALIGFQTARNADILAGLDSSLGTSPLVLEQIESFGKPVGREVFETVFWAGRFYQAWDRHHADYVYLLSRRLVKTHLCRSASSTDAHVRQALLDRFGPGKAKAVGLKRCPGPLYRLSADGWSALALAVVWTERECRDKVWWKP